MSRIILKNKPKDALTGADALVLAAPASLWKEGWADALSLVPGLESLIRAASLSGPDTLEALGGPKGTTRLVAIVLPNQVSRHNSDSKSAALWLALGRAMPDATKKTSVILGLENPDHYPALAVAVARRRPVYNRKTDAGRPAALTIAAMDAKGSAIKAPRTLSSLLEGVRWAAEMVDKPTSELDAAGFVREARKLCGKMEGVKSREIRGDKLLEAKLGGVHAVGRTAMVAPRMLILEYRPQKAKESVALVGKGVVYDTGGLSLKGKAGMPGMKSDMGGAAAVVGAFYALVAAKSKKHIMAVVPLAENAIGPAAVRNDDIITMHSGHTVEINNTDAEGRLLLGDAVSWVARKHNPDLIIDAATLTGAQLVATGSGHAAVVTNRQDVEDRAIAAGRTSGDLVHALPFCPEFYQAEFASKVADMRNSVANRSNAQCSCAAQFIYAHIDDIDPAWLHIDLAGPAFRERRGTGFGVALMAEIVG